MVGMAWMVQNTALLTLLGWLGGAVVASKGFCSSSGDLSPPVLLMNVSSARQGEVALAQCFILSATPASTIFFCKDGAVLATQSASQGQFLATLTFNLSGQSAGHYSCRFERIDHLHQGKTSSLSIPWHLSVTGELGPPCPGRGCSWLGPGSEEHLSAGWPGKDGTIVISPVFVIAWTGPPSGSSSSNITDSIPPCRRLDLGQVCLLTALSFLVLLPASYLLVKLVVTKQRCQRIHNSCLATGEQ
ncbi:uncharacterized protein LOC142025236 isoform X1 [Carettochelys insculpta]|uniref:uncharacterized protein LOC142025236 isoform X1 n=1 Tax=Carettochelys insculpta TaxID=44489 RepID=UPI003EBA581A